MAIRLNSVARAVLGGLALGFALCFAALTSHAQVQQGAFPGQVGGVYNVRAFGAICDGASHPLSTRYSTLAAAQAVYPSVTSLSQQIDQGAIQTAINAAEAEIANPDYWHPTFQSAVYIPAGTCFVNGLSITLPITFYGDGPNLTVIALAGSSNADVFNLPARPLTDPAQWNVFMQPFLHGFFIDGNQSNQTANSSIGIDFPDAPYSIGTRYAVAARIEDVTILSTAGDGMYIGANRNWGYADNMTIEYATATGVAYAAYDWYFNSLTLGENTDGFDVGSAGSFTVHQCNIFNNTEFGINISQYASGPITFDGCDIDSNGFDSLYWNGGGVASNVVTLMNSRSSNPSTESSGSYSHVVAANFGTLNLLNDEFITIGTTTYAAYVVGSDGSGNVNFIGNNYAGSPTPYLTAAFQSPSTVNALTWTGAQTFNGGFTATTGTFSSTITGSTHNAAGAGAISFGNATDGLQFQVGDSGAVAGNFTYVKGAANGSAPIFGCYGSSDANVNCSFGTKGTGQLRFTSPAMTYFGTQFVVASGTGACATTSTLNGGVQAGDFKCTGSTGASTVTLTLAATQRAYFCGARDVNNPTTVTQTGALSTTSVTFTMISVTTNDVISFGCGLSY